MQRLVAATDSAAATESERVNCGNAFRLGSSNWLLS